MRDLDKSIAASWTEDFSVPLIAVLLCLCDRDVVQAVVRAPSLLARLVQYTSRNMKAESTWTTLDLLVWKSSS